MEADEKNPNVALLLVARGAEVTLLWTEADDSTVDCLWDVALLIVEAEYIVRELVPESADGEV